MNGPYFRDHYTTAEILESNDNDTNSPVVNSNPFADRDPVDATLIHETPMGGTLAAISPMNEPQVGEIPTHENLIQEIPPLGGTLVGVDPLSQSIVHEAPIMDAALPYQAPMDVVDSPAVPVIAKAGSSVALLDREGSEHFRACWNEIQGKFVDEPRAAVQQADELVSDVIKKITQIFSNERRTLEVQWNQGNDVSTEDLRMALQRYRSFFNRLVL